MSKRLIKNMLLGIALVASSYTYAADTGKLNIGVYYFQGWYPKAPVENRGDAWCNRIGDLTQQNWDDPWCSIQPFYPERTPITTPVSSAANAPAGFYNQSDIGVVASQITQMSENGVNFVVFDWNAAADGTKEPGTVRDAIVPLYSDPLKRFKELGRANNLPNRFSYALLWDAYGSVKRTYTLSPAPMTWHEFKAIATLLVNDLADTSAPHLMVDNKPVLIINGIDKLKYFGTKMITTDGDAPPASVSNGIDGSSTDGGWLGAMTDVFRSIANDIHTRDPSKFPNGIHLVASTQSSEYWMKQALFAGFDALTSYNYHQAWVSDDTNGQSPQSTSYVYNEKTLSKPENWLSSLSLTNDYFINWIKAGQFADANHMRFYAPLTVGWDNRPWRITRGSTSTALNCPEHSCSTPANAREFEFMLREAQTLLNDPKNTDVTQSMAIICCWNEYGEGSILEPTVAHPDLLETVKKVFVAPFNFTVVGNSLTQNGPIVDPNTGAAYCWNHNWGMAVSDAYKDFAHILESHANNDFGGTSPVNLKVVGTWFEYMDSAAFTKTQNAKYDPKFELASTLNAISYDQNAVVVELGDDIVNKADFNEYFPKLLDGIVARLKPNGKLICTSVWFDSSKDKASSIRATCEAHGGAYVDILSLHTNANEAKADGIYTATQCHTHNIDDGVPVHPGENGHRAIADAIYNQQMQVLIQP